MSIKNLIFCRRGSVLLDVIVSIFILSLGLTGSMNLIVIAIQANKVSEQRLVATNLAQEGVEAMRSIRDTNWLTYSSDLRACWNFWEDTNEDGVVDGSDSDCTPNANGQNQHPWSSDIITGENYLEKYIIDFDPDTFRWKLISEDQFVNITSSPDYSDGFALFQKQINGSKFYTHDKDVADPSDIEDTPFYRSLSLYYIDSTTGVPFNDTLNPIEGGVFPVGSASKDNRILVVSRVYWTHSGTNHQIIMSTIMTDFYDRSEWTS